MELTKKEFELLTILEENQDKKIPQRTLSLLSGISIATINKLLNRFVSLNLINNEGITEAGYIALKPYRATKAVIMGAGFDSRLLPITLNTPKALIRIKGVRLIDTLIDALVDIGITDITIVRGYLGNQFDQLLSKYPMIRFVENSIYNESNNISSAMCVRHLFSNAYIMDADFVLYNPKILKKYHYRSNYLAIPTERTDGWCLDVKNGLIKKIIMGGTDCFHWLGISYWNKNDGDKLAKDIKTTYEMPGGHERFWDQVPLEYFAADYNVGICECEFEDIVEVDSFNELKTIDPSYYL